MAGTWLTKIFQEGGAGYLLWAIILSVFGIGLMLQQAIKGIKDWRAAKTVWAAAEEIGMIIVIAAGLYVFAKIDPIIVLDGVGEILSILWNKIAYPLIQLIISSIK